MKTKLQELGYQVMTKKTFNGDILYILLSQGTDCYVGSFKYDKKRHLVYSSEFKNLTMYELKVLSEVLFNA